MPDPSQMTILIQEEEWILVQSEEDETVYKGTYALRQRPQLPQGTQPTPEHAPVNMMFDCEVFLGEERMGNDDEEKNPNDPSNADLGGDEKKRGHLADDDSDECAQEEEEQEVTNPIITEFDDLELD